jgi:hypothetical protein
MLRMSSRLLGLLLIAAGLIALVLVGLIPASPMYAEVGASTVPAAVSLLLLLLAIGYAASAWRGRAPDAEADPTDAPEPGAQARFNWFLGGCIALAVLTQPAGFCVAAAVGGMGVARAFDQPLGWSTFAVCAAIAVSFWVLFSLLLGVDLGPAVAGLPKPGS